MFFRKNPKSTSRDTKAQKTRPAWKTKQSLLSLEPRLMFDGAAAATAAEVQSEQVAQDQAEAAVSSEAAGDDQTPEQNESQSLLHAIATYNPGESTTEVIFVDPTVPDCQTLIAGIGLNAEVIMLDPTRDGVEQIAESLVGRSGIDAIHLISHGSSGELQLGAGTLTAKSMAGEYADELATIREALSGQADILVYGCDFARGQDGEEAATLLSQLTGADVAASRDATGFAGLGGDWVLETQIGTIETQLIVTNELQIDWVALLAGETPPTITNLSGDNRAYSEGAGAVVIESGNAVVTDVDSANLDTGTLTVSIAAGGDSAEDVLSIRNQGTGAGRIGVSGSTVTYGGTTIGTFTGGSSGSDLVITLNSNATPPAVTALVRNITYQNTDTNAPTTGARTVRFVLTDGDGGTSANYDATVTVSAVNDAPADLTLSASTVAENAANGTVVGTVTAVDPDSGDTHTYTLTDNAGGRFAIDSSTGVITVANGTLLNYESAINHSVTVRVTDGGGLTYDKTFTITLTDAYEPLPPPNMPGSSGISYLIVPSENGVALFSLPDVFNETGKAEFRSREDNPEAIEVATETDPPADTVSLKEKRPVVAREEVLEPIELTARKNERVPATVIENRTKAKITMQEREDSASLASEQGDFQQQDRTSEKAIGMTMAFGLAGVAMQAAIGTERIIAHTRRPRGRAEGTSSDMKSDLSSEEDSRPLPTESGYEGPDSNKPGSA